MSICRLFADILTLSLLAASSYPLHDYFHPDPIWYKDMHTLFTASTLSILALYLISLSFTLHRVSACLYFMQCTLTLALYLVFAGCTVLSAHRVYTHYILGSSIPYASYYLMSVHTAYTALCLCMTVLILSLGGYYSLLGISRKLCSGQRLENIDGIYALAKEASFNTDRYIETNRQTLSSVPLTGGEVRRLLSLGSGFVGTGACALCSEGILGNEWSLTLPCTHSFHRGCILQQLLQGAECPVCRRSIRIGMLEGVCADWGVGQDGPGEYRRSNTDPALQVDRVDEIRRHQSDLNRKTRLPSIE